MRPSPAQRVDRVLWRSIEGVKDSGTGAELSASLGDGNSCFWLGNPFGNGSSSERLRTGMRGAGLLRFGSSHFGESCSGDLGMSFSLALHSALRVASISPLCSGTRSPISRSFRVSKGANLRRSSRVGARGFESDAKSLPMPKIYHK